MKVRSGLHAPFRAKISLQRFTGEPSGPEKLLEALVILSAVMLLVGGVLVLTGVL
jgi:hypothetical protein